MLEETTTSVYMIFLILQCLHSLEEIATGFHKKWYLFTMSFSLFLTWEILFQTFWIFILFSSDFPQRNSFMAFFTLLMFANGVQHLVWAGVIKKYVPGLFTAPLFILAFLWFYL